ncbi:LacI family transcriptional regulator [Tessaracoccus rhinocerotis]|uniref:LacI family transcriptional regulator n=1 Tax=Tessaracoccus rhinocerotis TaxID=1689449 RepID=A0A553JZJ8_9ACTN|nr:LacI family DNA-binding transcriptional regulator [Tessaracoccus rhinocerotis]TRY17875.1 LacI family transcriptional regulator [Tessaracoccus rhinocerotis]
MPSQPGRRVRAADVAAAAGVSPTAVSFVLNGRDGGNIAPETRNRILKEAARLGYEPHHVARSLRSRTTHSLGLVTDAVASSPFGGRLLAAASERAEANGYIMLVMDLHSREDREVSAIHELERRQVDAIIYVSMGFRVLDVAPKTRLPLVLANCTTGRDDELSVYPDDALGATRAIDHLAGLGHRRITMLSGIWEPGSDREDPGNISGPIRRDAFLKRAGELGVEAAVLESEWGIDDGYHAAMKVLDVPAEVRPTALFAVTDRAALGAMLAAARLGLSVPEDLSLVGFDDEERLAERAVPPLTTIALPHVRMGDEAVAMALAARAGEHIEDRRRCLPCELLVRESTAPPASVPTRTK